MTGVDEAAWPSNVREPAVSVRSFTNCLLEDECMPTTLQKADHGIPGAVCFMKMMKEKIYEAHFTSPMCSCHGLFQNA
jgi:hypothetical protein